ncbi:MAG: hypothetical protein L0Y42_11145 [Phycisphaerales bacterium]|nr:hypothetical protein [Phycisphaerales bacterium]
MPLADAIAGIEDRALQVQLWKGDRNVPAFATFTRNRLQPVVPGQQKPKAVDTWFVGVGRD